MNGKQNILVTGGTGYIGSNLINSLIKSNNNIAIVVRDINKVKRLMKGKVSYILYDENTFKSDISNFCPDIVVHLAAYSSSLDTVSEMKKLVQSNIIFTSMLLDALSDSKLQLFINTSSFSEYYYNNGTISPTYFYSATKTSARYIIDYFSKKNEFKFVNAILYTVYGKHGNNKKIIDYAIDSLDAKVAVKMSEGKQILDFIHIDDVVKFYINLIFNYQNFNISQKDYFVGTGKGISIRELVNVLENITNQNANILWGANKNRRVDTIQAVASTVKTLEDLNWTSKISITDGLSKYIHSRTNFE